MTMEIKRFARDLKSAFRLRKRDNQVYYDYDTTNSDDSDESISVNHYYIQNDSNDNDDINDDIRKTDEIDCNDD
jgi:hypothetical protein